MRVHSWAPQQLRSPRIVQFSGSAAGRKIVTAALAAVTAAVTAQVVTGLPALSMLAGAFGSTIPAWKARKRNMRERQKVHDSWPPVIDALANAVRAGVPLPAALVDCASAATEPLATSLRQLSSDLRTTGLVDDSLRVLANSLGDESSRRVVLALRTINDLGGSRAALMLAQLSASLREQARLIGEIEARRSWLNATSVIAVAAPWLTVIALGTRADTLARYATAQGTVVLLASACACLVGYAWMRRLGSLPAEPQVVRR